MHFNNVGGLVTFGQPSIYTCMIELCVCACVPRCVCICMCVLATKQYNSQTRLITSRSLLLRAVDLAMSVTKEEDFLSLISKYASVPSIRALRRNSLRAQCDPTH